jgi:hypothetical protein
MFRIAVLTAALALAVPVAADDAETAPAPIPEGAEALAEAAPDLVITEAGERELDEFLWSSRPLVVFADSPNDLRYRQQMELLAERPEELIERDVVVITDTDPAANSPIRQELRPRGFALVLIGKDGFKYLRKPLPWDVREISRSIDKMPLRQDEMRSGRGQ